MAFQEINNSLMDKNNETQLITDEGKTPVAAKDLVSQTTGPIVIDDSLNTSSALDQISKDSDSTST